MVRHEQDLYRIRSLKGSFHATVEQQLSFRVDRKTVRKKSMQMHVRSIILCYALVHVIRTKKEIDLDV